MFRLAMMALGLLVCATAAEAQLNVTDFGANGADQVDDTTALQACALALQAQTVRVTPPGGSGEASFPSVTFPPGTYIVTQMIDWGPYAHLIAQGSVMISVAPGVEAFRFTAGYMVRMEGFTFIGGATSVRFTNNNANGGRCEIERCRFQATTARAVLCYPVTIPYFSSNVTLRACKWHACQQALTTWADVTNLEDCWIQWSENVAGQNVKCIEVLGGRLNFENSMLVPVFPGGALGRRWIVWHGFPERNGGSGIFCDKVLFHGEFGGLPPIEICSPPDAAYPFQGPSVVLRGCQLSCGQTSWPDTAIINCNGGLPQVVYLDGSSSVIGPCPLIRDQSGTTEAIFNALQQGPNRVRIVVGANCFYPLVPPVPAFLQTYVRSLAG